MTTYCAGQFFITSDLFLILIRVFVFTAFIIHQDLPRYFSTNLPKIRFGILQTTE